MSPQDTKRLFIAIDMPFQVSKIIPMLQTVVTAPLGGIRWVSGKNLHLTLSFLGNVSNENLAELQSTLRENISGTNFKASIEGAGVFPNPNRPRILWLGMKKGAEEIIKHQKIVDQKVLQFKQSKKKGRFQPHITVGRVGKNIKPYTVKTIEFINAEYEPIVFTVDAIHLYKSELLPTGAKYTIIESFPLNHK